MTHRLLSPKEKIHQCNAPRWGWSQMTRSQSTMQSMQCNREHPAVLSSELCFSPETSQSASAFFLSTPHQMCCGPMTPCRWQVLRAVHETRGTQGTAQQDLRAATSRGPMCHGQAALSGWWSLHGRQNWYWTELGSACPMHTKGNLMTPGCGEGDCIYCRALSKENGRLVCERSELPSGFKARFCCSLARSFKDRVRRKYCRMCHQLMDNFLVDWWWRSRVVVPDFRPSTF